MCLAAAPGSDNLLMLGGFNAIVGYYSSPSIIQPLIIRTLGYPNSFKPNTTIKRFVARSYIFQRFTEILQIANMTTKGKYTVLSIEDKIAICEHPDKGSSKSDIPHEYYFMYICLIIQTF